jgi:hypothetical protein
MASVALDGQRRVICRILMQFKPNLLISVNDMRVLLMNRLDKLSLVQVHQL